MGDGSKPVRPHDPETIALGREQIALIRKRLRASPSRTRDRPPKSPDDVGHDTPAEEVDAFGDRMAAEMAAGAERDLLSDRVASLEVEVRQLRAALAAILHTAAGAVSEPGTASITDAPPSTISPDRPL